MTTSITLVFKQRLDYLRRGNFHGVSGNWLSKNTTGIYSSCESFVENKPWGLNLSIAEIDKARNIFETFIREKSGVNYNSRFDCEEGLASFLYLYIQHARPRVVVETGVANGITSNVIMSLLEKYGGELHSFDIDPKTRNAYAGSGNWKFHLIQGNHRESLKNQVSNLGKIDLWIHDSNHGYSWQTFEYQLAVKHLANDGVLVSDDIDSSTAWGMAKPIFKDSYAIFDNRKFFGVAKPLKKDF